MNRCLMHVTFNKCTLISAFFEILIIVLIQITSQSLLELLQLPFSWRVTWFHIVAFGARRFAHFRPCLQQSEKKIASKLEQDTTTTVYLPPTFSQFVFSLKGFVFKWLNSSFCHPNAVRLGSLLMSQTFKTKNVILRHSFPTKYPFFSQLLTPKAVFVGTSLSQAFEVEAAAC